MRLIFVIILFIVSAAGLQAQGFGVQAGVKLNNSKIEYPGVDVDKRLGFEAGVFYEIALPVISSWSVTPALLYSNSGFKLQDDHGNGTGITYHFTEHSIKLPVMIKKQFGIGPVKPFVKGGLYASYAFSGRVKDSETHHTLKYENDSDKMDYGASLGVGVRLLSRIGLDVNYDLSFAKRSIVLGDQFVSVKNRGSSISLSYLF